MENLTGFGKILEQSLNEIYIFEAQTLVFKMVNRGGRLNTGYTTEELKTLTPIHLIPGYPEENFREFVTPLLNGEIDKLVFETQHLRKDRSTYDVSVNLQLIVLDGEKQFVAIVDDITEKKAAKTKLEESEKHFRTLVNHIPDVITRFDTDLRILYISDSVVHYTGKQPDFYIGKTQEELGYRKDLIAIFLERAYEAIVDKRVVFYETMLPKQDKGFRFYANSVVPEFGINGQEVMSLLTISRDITQQKKMELKLQNHVSKLKAVKDELSGRNKQLEDFANIASHNLRSPVGNLQVLLNLYDTETDPDKKEFFIQKFKEVAERLDQTVGNLTEVVKIRMDLDKKREPLFFDKILQEIINSLSGHIFESQAKITWNFSQCETISYPRVYLESILLNLLTNSLKYRSSDRITEVYFETKIIKNTIQLTCKDNGLGIDLKRHKHKLFGMNKTFHRNENARGIGLFITKNQIEALGGTIKVKSEVNVGTKFIILFAEKDRIYEKNRYGLYSGR